MSFTKITQKSTARHVATHYTFPFPLSKFLSFLHNLTITQTHNLTKTLRTRRTCATVFKPAEQPPSPSPTLLGFFSNLATTGNLANGKPARYLLPANQTTVRTCTCKASKSCDCNVCYVTWFVNQFRVKRQSLFIRYRLR